MRMVPLPWGGSPPAGGGVPTAFGILCHGTWPFPSSHSSLAGAAVPMWFIYLRGSGGAEQPRPGGCACPALRIPQQALCSSGPLLFTFTHWNRKFSMNSYAQMKLYLESKHVLCLREAKPTLGKEQFRRKRQWEQGEFPRGMRAGPSAPRSALKAAVREALGSCVCQPRRGPSSLRCYQICPVWYSEGKDCIWENTLQPALLPDVRCPDQWNTGGVYRGVCRKCSASPQPESWWHEESGNEGMGAVPCTAGLLSPAVGQHARGCPALSSSVPGSVPTAPPGLLFLGHRWTGMCWRRGDCQRWAAWWCQERNSVVTERGRWSMSLEQEDGAALLVLGDMRYDLAEGCSS